MLVLLHACAWCCWVAVSGCQQQQQRGSPARPCCCLLLLAVCWVCLRLRLVHQQRLLQQLRLQAPALATASCRLLPLARSLLLCCCLMRPSCALLLLSLLVLSVSQQQHQQQKGCAAAAGRFC
jgi:hypothetical protein